MKGTRPNILWICTDQQRYDTIGALGNPHVDTPNIDRLIAEGFAFTHAYCQSPICTPSRTSFLTGQYASAVHVNGNGNSHFPDAPPLVTKILTDNGYDCGLIGKLHLSSAHGRIEKRVDDGYRYWQYSHAPRDDWETGHDYADWVRSKAKSWANSSKVRRRTRRTAPDHVVCGKNHRIFERTARWPLVGLCEYLRPASAI